MDEQEIQLICRLNEFRFGKKNKKKCGTPHISFPWTLLMDKGHNELAFVNY